MYDREKEERSKPPWVTSGQLWSILIIHPSIYRSSRGSSIDWPYDSDSRITLMLVFLLLLIFRTKSRLAQIISLIRFETKTCFWQRRRRRWRRRWWRVWRRRRRRQEVYDVFAAGETKQARYGCLRFQSIKISEGKNAETNQQLQSSKKSDSLRVPFPSFVSFFSSPFPFSQRLGQWQRPHIEVGWIKYIGNWDVKA